MEQMRVRPMQLHHRKEAHPFLPVSVSSLSGVSFVGLFSVFGYAAAVRVAHRRALREWPPEHRHCEDRRQVDCARWRRRRRRRSYEDGDEAIDYDDDGVDEHGPDTCSCVLVIAIVVGVGMVGIVVAVISIAISMSVAGGDADHDHDPDRDVNHMALDAADPNSCRLLSRLCRWRCPNRRDSNAVCM